MVFEKSRKASTDIGDTPTKCKPLKLSLSPDRESILPARYTSMPAIPSWKIKVVELDNVYQLSVDAVLSIQNRTLHIHSQDSVRRERKRARHAGLVTPNSFLWALVFFAVTASAPCVYYGWCFFSVRCAREQP